MPEHPAHAQHPEHPGPPHEPGVAHVRICATDAATAHRVADVIASRYPRTRPPSVSTTADGLVEFVLYTDTLDVD
jgi:hypothetical protein